MADIPNQPVVRLVEHIREGDRQFNHAQSRAKVPAGDAHRVNHFRTQLIRQLAQLAGLEPPQIDGRGHRVERSEEHTSELQSLMRISYAVFCLKKKNKTMTNAKQIRHQTKNLKTKRQRGKECNEKNK